MFVYIENPKKSTKFLELIKKFSKVIGLILKKIVFLYISNEQLFKIKILKIQFLQQKVMKYLGMIYWVFILKIKNIPSNIKENVNKLKNIKCSWIGGLTIFKL